MDIQSLEMDVSCYASAAYHEGSTKNERIAILHTIRNRLKSGRWGNTVCSVVYADKQFIGVWDDTHEKIDEKTYLETKLLVLDTIVFHKYRNEIGNALYFHDRSIPKKSKWFGHSHKKTINNLEFY
jgi:hypothetical protein